MSAFRGSLLYVIIPEVSARSRGVGAAAARRDAISLKPDWAKPRAAAQTMGLEHDDRRRDDHPDAPASGSARPMNGWTAIGVRRTARYEQRQHAAEGGIRCPDAFAAQNPVVAVVVSGRMQQRGDHWQARGGHELSCQKGELAGCDRGNAPMGSIRPPQQGQSSCGLSASGRCSRLSPGRI
jgi:hypothetical protein